MAVDLRIRRLHQGDLDAAEHILSNSFTTPANRRRDLECGLLFQPEGWWLALLADEPVGMVGAIEYDRFAWVGLMGVHRLHQSKGIGRALMKHLLADLDSRRIPMILLDASDAGKPLYESLGFVDEGICRLYQRTTDEPKPAAEKLLRAPARQEQNREQGCEIIVRPASIADLKEMVAYDRPIFGADRTRVFQEFFSRFPDRAFLARDRDGRLRGLIFAQYRRIGPWIADGPMEAELLLQRVLGLSPTDGSVPEIATDGEALSGLSPRDGSVPEIARDGASFSGLSFEGPAQFIAPDLNTVAAGLAARYGFSANHANLHMRRGGTGLSSADGEALSGLSPRDGEAFSGLSSTDGSVPEIARDGESFSGLTGIRSRIFGQASFGFG